MSYCVYLRQSVMVLARFSTVSQLFICPSAASLSCLAWRQGEAPQISKKDQQRDNLHAH